MIIMNYIKRSDLIDKGGWLTWLSLCLTFSSWRHVCSHWQWHLVAVQWHYTSWWLQKSTAIKSVFTLKKKQKHDYKRLLISVLDIMLATCVSLGRVHLWTNVKCQRKTKIYRKSVQNGLNQMWCPQIYLPHMGRSVPVLPGFGAQSGPGWRGTPNWPGL